MNIDSLIESEDRLTKTIRQLDNERDEVRQKIAEHNCPFKVGDSIENNAVKAKVVQISHADYNPYKLIIRKIKKDGTPYAYDICAHYPFDWELAK